MSSIFTWTLVTVTGGLLSGMLALIEVGRRLGMRQLARDPAGARTGLGVIEAAIFTLLGLLLAFCFSGAAGRFDARRQLVVDEANAIGTAYLRLDLLSPNRRQNLQELFRQYADARLELYRSDLSDTRVREGLAKTAALQNEIWKESVAGTRDEGYQAAAILLLPALNAMIDITTTRTMAAQTHPPLVIFLLLGVLLLVSGLLAGMAMAGGKGHSWIHIFAFALISAATMFVIVDLEYPRLGLIRLDAFDQVLVEVRQSMK